MGIELAAPEWMIENEIKQGCDQKRIAETLALAIVMGGKNVDWRRIHKAISDRWSPSAVDRIKKKAWKIVEGKRREAMAKQASSN